MPPVSINNDILVDSLPGIFYLFDANGKFLFWNRNFEIVSGYSAAEIAKMNPLDFFDDQEKTYIQQQIIKVFTEGPTDSEAHFLTKDGRQIPYHFSGKLVILDGKPHLIGMAVDISERKRAEEKLEESQRHYKDLFNHSPLPQWILDAKTLQFLEVNAAAVKHYGYSEEEFLSHSIIDVLTKEHKQLLQKNKKSFQITKQPFFSKWKHQKKNGEVILTDVTSVGVNYENKKAVLCIVNDITEKTMHQQELTSSVIEAQERERSQLGRELHDNINQVLTTIKLYTELMLSDDQKSPELLTKSSYYLQKCIDEIRSISKRLSAPSIGKISLEDSIMELTHSINLTNKITVDYSIDDLTAVPISEELHMTIYRILQEALNNVMKHAHATKVSVKLTWHPKKKCLELIVEDNGKGFDLNAKRKGIGLSNIKSRAENMQGRIKIDSVPGEGCKLAARFPV